MLEFERRVIPKHGLDELVFSNELKKKLSEIVNHEKARKILYAHWGFDDRRTSCVAIFCGGPGKIQRKFCDE